MHHEHSLAGAKTHQSRRTALFRFTRVDLSVPVFVFAAYGAALVSAMGIVAWNANPKDFHAVPLALFFPAFVLAIVQRRWTSLPFWACFFAASWAGLSRSREFMEPHRRRYYLYLLCLVLVTELARLIRGNKQTS